LYKYSSKELDEEIGLEWYYFGARYYPERDAFRRDPEIARWLAVDPAAFKYPGWSPYNYTLNNPLRYTDSDGRAIDGGIIEGVSVGAIIGALAATTAMAIHTYRYTTDDNYRAFCDHNAITAITVGTEVVNNVVDATVNLVTSIFSTESNTPAADGGIEIPEADKIPNDQLNPPDSRGKAPTDKETGKSIEIHHVGQDPKGPHQEKKQDDHRGKGYDKKNHPDKNKKSKIDRNKWKKQREDYWKKEWDRGRWNNNNGSGGGTQ